MDTARHRFSHGNASNAPRHGGYGLTPNTIAQFSAKVVMASRFLGLVGSLPASEQTLWFPNQDVKDPDTWTFPPPSTQTGIQEARGFNCVVQESYLSHIMRRSHDDRFPIPLWETWFCSSLGVPILALVGHPQRCSCRHFRFDPYGRSVHLQTCQHLSLLLRYIGHPEKFTRSPQQ